MLLDCMTDCHCQKSGLWFNFLVHWFDDLPIWKINMSDVYTKVVQCVIFWWDTLYLWWYLREEFAGSTNILFYIMKYKIKKIAIISVWVFYNGKNVSCKFVKLYLISFIYRIPELEMEFALKKYLVLASKTWQLISRFIWMLPLEYGNYLNHSGHISHAMMVLKTFELFLSLNIVSHQ